MRFFLFFFACAVFSLQAQEYKRSEVKALSGRAYLKTTNKPLTGTVIDFFRGTEKIQAKTMFKNGMKHGIFIIYDENGFGIKRWNYAYGKKHDTTFIFNSNKQLKTVEVYNKGRLVKQNSYPSINENSKGGVIYIEGERKDGIHIMRLKSAPSVELKYGIRPYSGKYGLMPYKPDGEVEVLSYIVEGIDGDSNVQLIGKRIQGNTLNNQLKEEIVSGRIKKITLKSIRVKNSDGYMWEVSSKVIRFNTKVG